MDVAREEATDRVLEAGQKRLRIFVNSLFCTNPMVFPVFGHIAVRNLFQCGRSDKDVHVCNKHGHRDESDHNGIVHAILELVPLESGRCDEEVAWPMIGHGPTCLQLEGC